MYNYSTNGIRCQVNSKPGGDSAGASRGWLELQGIDRAAELLAEFDFAYGMYDVDVSVDYFIDDEYIDLPYRLEVAREGWPLLWDDESPWDHDQWKAWLTLRTDTLRAELSAKTVKVLTLTIELAVSPEDAKRIKGVKDLLDLSDELRRK